MLAQQPVPPYPPRTVFRRRQLGPKAAPRIGPQALLHLKQPGTHRIEMPVITGRAQVAAAAPCHQLRLIPPAQNMAEEFMLVVKADGLGAFQPSHAARQAASEGHRVQGHPAGNAELIPSRNHHRPPAQERSLQAAAAQKPSRVLISARASHSSSDK